MKKKIVLPIIILLLLVYIYRNLFTEAMLVGTYVISKSENRSVNILDIPNERDTLIISKGNIFKNTSWGEGTYKLSPSIFGTRIDFYYNYEFGKAGFQASVVRTLFRDFRISINHDSKIYYYKVE